MSSILRLLVATIVQFFTEREIDKYKNKKKSKK